ncbi:MAG: 50S ribosomal protein L18 [Candidatus Methanofastidiosa archaeon]|nr:50S ribosomal protein L18 [Candidatus Methanofastidiosa archaeon]
MSGPRYAVPFRRRREGKTDFRSRRKMLYSGKPRFVVRKSLCYVWAQVTVTGKNGDEILVSAHSKELSNYGWKGSFSNTPASYLTGYLCGLRANKLGISDAILDMGLYDVVKGSKIFACLKGFADGDVDIPFDESIVPSEDRISGQHIVTYYEGLDEEERAKRFSKYIKNDVVVNDLPDLFSKTKKEIGEKER